MADTLLAKWSDMLGRGMAGLILKAGGLTENATPKNGTDFKLEELKAIVGGHIEIVWLPNDMYLVANENGHQLGLSPNRLASEVAKEIIVGDCLLCKRKFIK